MSAGTNASTEASQLGRKAAPLSRCLPSPLKKLHERWRSMKADECLYSFRFGFWGERIPIQPERSVRRFSGFAVGHCQGTAFGVCW